MLTIKLDTKEKLDAFCNSIQASRGLYDAAFSLQFREAIREGHRPTHTWLYEMQPSFSSDGYRRARAMDEAEKDSVKSAKLFVMYNQMFLRFIKNEEIIDRKQNLKHAKEKRRKALKELISAIKAGR